MSRRRDRTRLRRFHGVPNRKLEDRYYTNDEFYRCAIKLRHPDWLSAILHIRRLKLDRPLAYMQVYECHFCDGLHITTGKVDKDYFKLKDSLETLTKMMEKPGYAKAPREVQSHHAQVIVHLRERIVELETAYELRKLSKSAPLQG